MKKLILIALLSTISFAQAKSLYMISTVLNLAHEGYVDARIWDKGQIPQWMKKDEFYLGGRFVFISLNLVTAYQFAKSTNLTTFCKATAAGIDLGSIAWDWIYGILQYRNPLYPYENWVTIGGHKIGFKDIWQRLAFDTIRAYFAVMLLIEGENK